MRKLNEQEMMLGAYDFLGLYELALELGYEAQGSERGFLLSRKGSSLLTEEGKTKAFAWLEKQVGRRLPPLTFTGETDYRYFDGEDGPRCLEHTLIDYFGGSVSAFEDTLENRDTSFRDFLGRSLIARHTDSFQDAEYSMLEFPEGLQCGYPGCEAILEEPTEENLSWEE